MTSEPHQFVKKDFARLSSKMQIPVLCATSLLCLSDGPVEAFFDKLAEKASHCKKEKRRMQSQWKKKKMNVDVLLRIVENIVSGAFCLENDCTT